MERERPSRLSAPNAARLPARGVETGRNGTDAPVVEARGGKGPAFAARDAQGHRGATGSEKRARRSAEAPSLARRAAVLSAANVARIAPSDMGALLGRQLRRHGMRAEVREELDEVWSQFLAGHAAQTLDIDASIQGDLAGLPVPDGGHHHPQLLCEFGATADAPGGGVKRMLGNGR